MLEMTVGAAGPWAGLRMASPSSAAVRAVAAWPVTCELMPKLPGGMSGTWLALKLGRGPHDNRLSSQADRVTTLRVSIVATLE